MQKPCDAMLPDYLHSGSVLRVRADVTDVMTSAIAVATVSIASSATFRMNGAAGGGVAEGMAPASLQKLRMSRSCRKLRVLRQEPREPKMPTCLLDHWESYAFDELLYDLKAIWDAKWPGKYFVVGHSFGSHLVLRLGAMLADTMLAGDTIAGLILLGAAKQFPEGHPIFRLPVFVLQWLQPSLTKAFLQMALASNDPELIQQETDGCNANPMYM
eukprot:g15017.t1